MQQHPVPQNIASYEFKLVGDMTLKQFFQLASGAIISLIIYATPLPGIIKWPLVFIFGALGAALAFLPVEERPLSTWMFAFFKAIYTPTRYVFEASSAEDVFAKTKTQDNSPALQSQHKPTGAVETFEAAERSFFQRVSNLFQTTSTQGTQAPQVPNMNTQPSESPIAQGRVLEMQQVQTPVVPQPQQTSNRPSFKVVEELDIPKIQPIAAGAPVIPQMQQPQQQTQVNTTPIAPVFRPQAPGTNPISATFNNQASPPSPPSIPNTVTGQVLSSDGKIIDGAIMEIKDPSGKPVRAIRTNKVGHFLTVTPLADGDYVIETEKEGFVFDQIKFTASGGIIPPIQITSK